MYNHLTIQVSRPFAGLLSWYFHKIWSVESKLHFRTFGSKVSSDETKELTIGVDEPKKQLPVMAIFISLLFQDRNFKHIENHDM